MTEEVDSSVRQRRPRKKRSIKKSRMLVALLGILVLTWFLGGSLRSVLYRSLLEVQTLQPGIVTEDFASEGVLIKQEYLIAAPLKGAVSYSLADGQRVKAGTSFGVLKVTTMESSSGVREYALRAPVSGVLCNHVDGLETILVPGNLDVVEIPALDKIVDKPSQSVGPVENGQAVAKVIDNLAPVYIYGVLDDKSYGIVSQAKETYLKLKWQDQIIEAKVDKLLSGKQKGVFLLVKNYPDELLHARKLSYQVNVRALEGFLVPEDALFTKEGQSGLYVVWKDLVRWSPVKVEGRLRGQAAITGEVIQPGVRYVVNPRFAREGDRL